MYNIKNLPGVRMMQNKSDEIGKIVALMEANSRDVGFRNFLGDQFGLQSQISR